MKNLKKFDDQQKLNKFVNFVKYIKFRFFQVFSVPASLTLNIAIKSMCKIIKHNFLFNSFHND